MDFELRAAQRKLEREQKERKARAISKLEKERKAKVESSRHRDAIEAAQRARRLDSADAHLKEEQRMEESLFLGKGIMFSETLEAVPFDGYGDKIKLPPSCFTKLSDQGALDRGPMCFRLSRLDELVPNADGNLVTAATHSGVLEFTASEGYVELPPRVWSNLFLENDGLIHLIEVRYVSLPKGTYAKLQSEGLSLMDIPNHKAMLETTLRKHATLSQGDIFTVTYGELEYRLRVLELKPASSVTVLETDIEVDIEMPQAVSDNINNGQFILAPLVLGKPMAGVVEEGAYDYYKFSIEENIFNRVLSENMVISVNIEADSSSGDTNIYVSRHPILFPTNHRHEWSSHEMGSKSLILEPNVSNLTSGTYSIGVYGFRGSTNYNISVVLEDHTARSRKVEAGTPSEVDVNSVACKNCGHYVSNRSIVLHEAYCVRHNVVCRHEGCGIVLRKEEEINHLHCIKCDKPFHRAEIEKHMKVFHEPLNCACGVILEKEKMVQHQSLRCPLRLITCRFCGDIVQAGSLPSDGRDRLRGLSEHESLCGSRTMPCDSCGRSIMLKEMELHVMAIHQKS